MQHFQHIMVYNFKKGKNTTETQKKYLYSIWRCYVKKKKICVSVWNVSKWFLKFRAGDVSLDDAPQSGRPVEVEGLSNPDIN